MSRSAITLFILSLTLMAAFMANLMLGDSYVSVSHVIEMIWAHSAQDFVIWNHRLPRSIIALIVGASFGFAGAIIQGIIRNPLASPEILGVSQGAGLALTITVIAFPLLPITWFPLITCIGGAIGVGLLILYSLGSQFSTVKFALSGVAISMTLSCITEFLILSHPLDINTALLVLTGSLWSRGWHHVYLALPLIPLLCFAYYLAKPLNLIVLGNEVAITLGTKLQHLRWLSIGIAVIVSSLCVGIVGPVSFIGLVAPHMARRLVGAHHQYTLVASMMVGAILLIIADTLGRILIAPSEIPSGILTAVIGAPYFLWLLVRMKDQ